MGHASDADEFFEVLGDELRPVVGFVGPGADEIDELVARVMGDPALG
jgi:hypothetical protein